jgi:ATP-dependent Clp endopeptidase proteolytic subunit ClpP
VVDKLAAEVAKLTAETAEIEARMARAATVGRQSDERAAIRKEEMELALAKHKRDDALLLTDYRFDHTLNFIGAVTDGTTQTAIERLHQFDVIDPKCDITITINSPGGSSVAGMALFDYIRYLRSKGHKVTAIGMGWTASMGGVIMQAADVRVMTKGTWLLIHEGSIQIGGDQGKVDDWHDWGKRVVAQMLDIYVERSGGKITREQFAESWKRKDWWLSAEEALSYGFIDEVR